MENRFGVKDFILYLLMAVLIALSAAAMWQYDRQWDKIRGIEDKLDEQAKDIRGLRTQIGQGILIGGGPATTNRFGEPNPFEAVVAARTMPGFADGGTLSQGFGGTVAKLTPLLSGDAYAAAIQARVLESLAVRDARSLKWQPLLAEKWESAPDGMWVKFTLRERLNFSDGRPLTVDDVVFTFNFIMNEKVNAPRQRAYFKTMDRVEKTGPREVTFFYKEPYFEFFELAASMEVLPKHFYESFTIEQFNDSKGLLLGSGPYRLEDPRGWNPGTGQPITLVRNDRYWGELPAIERLIYREFTLDAARLTAFRNGEIDQFGAFPEQFVELQRDARLMERVQAFEYLSAIGGYRYIAWNQRRQGSPTYFADKRVRQAMTMLIDRQRLLEQIMLDKAVLVTGPFNPQSRQFNTELTPWPFDVARARSLLEEAGFRDSDGDGILNGPDGKSFSFRLTYPSGSSNFEKMVLLIRDSLSRGGVKVEPDAKEWGVFTDLLNRKDFDAITLGWTAGIETDIYQMFHSSQAVAEGDNFMSYKSEALDKTIEEARRTIDEEKRMELWRRAHAILHEDQPYTFLWVGKSLLFIQKRIHNVQKVTLGLNPIEEWFIPLNMRAGR